MEQRFKRMTETPIKPLVITLAIPTIISMLVTSIYNMADTFFVAQIGTSATAGVGVAFPVMAIIQAIGFTFGHGGGNYISRLLGQRNRERAETVMSNAFFTAFAVGLFCMAAGLLFLEPLVYLLGSTETIAPYAMDYLRYILLGFPFMTCSFVLNNILRYQGSAFFAMIGITIGGVLNIVLDPIFIFTFGLGTAGAAIATILSQFISFCVLVWQCFRGGNLRIRISRFRFEGNIFVTILKGGLPSFYRQGLNSVATTLLNTAAAGYGDAAVAAMSIVGRVFMFAFSAMLGFGQGFQPVCGFNYGAKRYNRVLEAYWFLVKTAAGILLALAVIGIVFAPQIMMVFRRDDADVIRIGSFALRAYFITFPLAALNVPSMMMTQTIGKSLRASILSLSRQGLFLIPALLILPQIIGLTGVQIAQPVADILSFCISAPMAYVTVKEIRALEREQAAQGENGGNLSEEEIAAMEKRLEEMGDD